MYPPTSDGGKVCSSSGECEGRCIAELSPENLTRAEKGETAYAKGKCRVLKIVLGRRPFLENETVRFMCVD